jgi:membrane-associated protease RseP (regulator of RpoE activity)
LSVSFRMGYLRRLSDGPVRITVSVGPVHRIWAGPGESGSERRSRLFLCPKGFYQTRETQRSEREGSVCRRQDMKTGLSIAVFRATLRFIARLGSAFMRILRCLFVLVSMLLIGSSASAQDAKGWLGADVQDVTKAEADKLGWDIPHGAKVGLVASGSPADKAGLKPGDVVRAMDGIEIETSGVFERAIDAKTPGAQTSLLVLSAGVRGTSR